MSILVYGTKKEIKTHFESDGRPTYLGGRGANTGTTYDRNFKRYAHVVPPIPAIEQGAVIDDQPTTSEHKELVTQTVREYQLDKDKYQSSNPLYIGGKRVDEYYSTDVPRVAVA